MVQSTDQPGGRGKSSEPWLVKLPKDVAGTLPIPGRTKQTSEEIDQLPLLLEMYHYKTFSQN